MKGVTQMFCLKGPPHGKSWYGNRMHGPVVLSLIAHHMKEVLTLSHASASAFEARTCRHDM